MARAGQFRERAAFERQADAGTRDAYGNRTAAAWVPLMSCWADLREVPGRELIAAGRLEGRGKGTLRVRYSAATAGVTAGDRVTVRGATWAITSPPADIGGRRKVLEFTVERGGAVQ